MDEMTMLRLEALRLAAGNPGYGPTDEDIVVIAQRYYDFMVGRSFIRSKFPTSEPVS